MSLKPFLPVAACLIASSLAGADYYLDNVKGSDSNSGLKDAPMATFKALEKKLAPGDNVFLNPTGKIYRQEFVIYSAGGKPGKYLTINGNGQTVSGSEIIPASSWKKISDGVYKAEKTMAKVGLIVDNKVVLEQLNRDSLKPGEWCWRAQDKIFYYMPDKNHPIKGTKFEVTMVDGSNTSLDPAKFQHSHSKIGAKRYRNLKEVVKLTVNGKVAKRGWAKDSLKPGNWNRTGNDIYYRPTSGADVRKQKIEAMVRGNGFALAKNASYVKVFNVNAQHVYNDGYNIHNNLKGVIFDQCNARQCGDEGVSAHGTCEITFTNSVIRECDNGMNHVQDAKSVTRNIYIADCRNNGIEFQGGKKSCHSVENAVLVNNRVQMTWRSYSPEPIVIKNVLGISDGKSQALVMLSGKTEFKNMTLIAPRMRFNFRGNTPLSLKNAAFYVPKMEFDIRKRPLDFLTLSGVEIPENTVLHNAYRNREPFIKTGKSGLKTLAVTTPFSVSAAIKQLCGKPVGAPESLYQVYQQNNRKK